jgi:hypothetical protein
MPNTSFVNPPAALTTLTRGGRALSLAPSLPGSSSMTSLTLSQRNRSNFLKPALPPSAKPHIPRSPKPSQTSSLY